MTILSLSKLKELMTDNVTLLSSLVSLGLGYFLLRRYLAGGQFKSQTRLDGKTVIITGAYTGIGKETARDLASRGANVILACRDESKGNQAATDIKKTTGQTVTVRHLDLSSLTSVRKFASDINKDLQRLDILINNAAVAVCPFSKSADGFELQFATNQLGHFLLTLLLLDLLEHSAPSRIVVVSGLAYEYGDLDLDNLNGEKSYGSVDAYIQSKIANIMFALELSSRLKGQGVTVNCLHPGVVNSGLSRHIDELPIAWVVKKLLAFFKMLIYPFCKTTKEGAQTSVYCAVAEELEGVTGRYFRMTILSLSTVKELATNNATPLSLIVSVGLGYFLVRRYLAGGQCRSRARLDGKTVIITGANTGIGKETARDLASRGANVILACRDESKGNQAATDIKQTTGQTVTVRHLDLSSLASVRKFAAEINKDLQRLDILINNAAVAGCPFTKSADGFELQFATNQLGHFLLTLLLLDLLEHSAPSRIVVVSALAYEYKDLDLDNLNGEKSYGPINAYIQSKIANIMFAVELSSRLKGQGVTVNSLHPGVIKTGLSRHSNELPFSWVLKKVFAFYMMLIGIFCKTVKEGAQTSIYCAVAEELEGVTGRYFSDCQMKELKPHVLDADKRKKLWLRCVEMVKLTDAEMPKCLQ